MRRLSGRSRSALIIGVQGIRARKLRTLLSMISLFLGVLAVVVVQAGASIAEQASVADLALVEGIDGTTIVEVPGGPRSPDIVLDTVRGRADAVASLTVTATIGEPNVTPVNPNGSPFDESWGPNMICDQNGCVEEKAGPSGQAIQLGLTALTGDVRTFRPLRLRTGRWLDFGTVPAMAPALVLNEEAAKGFGRYRVPAEMRVGGATAPMTPRLVGVVQDGSAEPRAYVRFDELATWVPPAGLADPNAGGQMQVLLQPSSPVEQVLVSRLQGTGAGEVAVRTVDSLQQIERQLALMRLIFLAMAGLVLLIGVAGILNVGLATVGERIEEFALRRAVGTPRSLLAGIVLAETLLTGMLTAGAAIGAGMLGLKALSMLFGDSEPLLADVQFPWEAGVAGIVAGLIAGILGGFVPALRAARIPIATVMRA